MRQQGKRSGTIDKELQFYNVYVNINQMSSQKPSIYSNSLGNPHKKKNRKFPISLLNHHKNIDCSSMNFEYISQNNIFSKRCN